MKGKLKYTLLAIIAILVFCSFTYSNREGHKIECKEQMETLYYRNHSYICYRFYGDPFNKRFGGASIMHDPDCKCKKGK